VADFNISYPLTSGNEGYYVSQEYFRAHGDKNSGETYMGVDRIQNPGWAGWPIIDKYKAANGPISYNTRLPQSLGLEDLVKQYAKQKYWDAMKGDQIVDQDVANMLFEQIWGGYGGIKAVQTVINSLITPDSIKVDGGVGADTLARINSIPPAILYPALYNQRQDWIDTVGARINPGAVTGWTTRLERFAKSFGDEVSTATSDFVANPVAAVKKNPVIFIGGATIFFTSLAVLAWLIGKVGKGSVNVIKPA
jgi:lysozyme family protein